MSHDYRSSNYSDRRSQPHRRKVNRRTSNRETVQSDELSSTNGARLVSSANPYDPTKNPHLSSTSLPVIDATGLPHPKSPAARAQQQNAHAASAPSALITDAAKSPEVPEVTGAVPNLMNPTKLTNLTNSTNPEQSSPSQSENQPAVDREPENFIPSERTQLESNQRTVAPSQRTYQDYTQASGRYKARTGTINEDASGFVPIHAASQHARKRKKTWPRVVAAIAVVAALGIGGYFGFEQLAYAGPVQATVNGETMTLEGDERSIEGLLDNNIVSVTPGNYVAVDNSVMREGEGTRCSALINEQQITDLKTHINEGDSVVVSNGTDVMEAYTDSEPTITPAGYSKAGQYGALHVFLPGQDGETVTRTGSESGIAVEQVTKEKIDDRLVYYNADSNGKKVIALTFDDGPWDTTTDQILDILKENGAKATFYTIGEQVPSHSDQIKRMAAEGHEIATHTWDHAAGSGKGVSLDLMSTAERQEEVQKGLNVIKEVSGKDASVYFRAPGGNFGESTAADLKGMVSGEIGWNIDTEDWRRPGASVIAERIKSAKPGEIVLMHDGGGDRSQTVAGLREALTYLKGQGYEFVTVSELIESYPYQEGQHS